MRDVRFYQSETDSNITGYISGGSCDRVMVFTTFRGIMYLWGEHADSDDYLYRGSASEIFQDPFNPTHAERTLFELNFNMPYPPQEMLSKLQHRS